MTAINFSHAFIGRRRGGGESYWVSRIQDSYYSTAGLCVNSSGKVFITGNYFPGVSGSQRLGFIRLNANGSFDTALGTFDQWRAWGGPAVSADGSSSVYVPANRWTDSDDLWYPWISTIGGSDSDYVLRSRLSASIKSGVATDLSVTQSSIVAVDSSGNPYFAGIEGSAGTVWKLNTSLGQVWATRLTQTYASQWTGIDVRGSDVAVATSQYRADAPNYHGFVAKLATSNGSVSWQKQLLPPSGSEIYIDSVALDSTGRVIVVGRGYVTGANNRAMVAVISADGSSIDWIRQFYVSGRNIVGTSVQVDAADNVYALFYDGNTGPVYLAKYNSSGTLQWQRRFTYPSAAATGRGLYVRGDVMWVSMLWSIYNAGGGNIFVWKLPTNGGKAGTDVNLGSTSRLRMQYLAATATDEAWTGCSLAAGPASVGAQSASFASGTFTPVSDSPNVFNGVL